MSAVEIAIEKVKEMNEAQARALLFWIELQQARPTAIDQPRGAKAMVGFARRFRKEPRTTASWMDELRDGER